MFSSKFKKQNTNTNTSANQRSKLEVSLLDFQGYVVFVKSQILGHLLVQFK